MTFEDFVKTLQVDTYPEPPSELHSAIIREMVPKVCALTDKDCVLDVGCGQGVAFEEFCKAGMSHVYGLTAGQEDAKAAKRKAAAMNEAYDGTHIAACCADMHGAIVGRAYSLIWARHALEHSPAPYYMLHEFKRILKPGGILYVEVPAPGTDCCHETNKNHYSVLTFEMWLSLLARAGYQFVETGEIPLQTQAGADTYFYFIVKRP